MTTTRIRTTIATLAATCVAAVTVAPAAQAVATRVPVGTPGGNVPTITVAENKKKTAKKPKAQKVDSDRCYELAMAIMRNRDDYYEEKNKPDADHFEVQEALHIWNESLNNYEKAGCHQS